MARTPKLGCFHLRIQEQIVPSALVAKPSGLAREQISQIFESLAIKSPFKTSGPEGLPPGLPNLNLILRLPFLNVFL